MKKYFIVFFAFGMLFGITGCEIMKNSYESQFLDCKAHCQTSGLKMNIEQTKRTNDCRCS